MLSGCQLFPGPNLHPLKSSFYLHFSLQEVPCGTEIQ